MTFFVICFTKVALPSILFCGANAKRSISLSIMLPKRFSICDRNRRTKSYLKLRCKCVIQVPYHVTLTGYCATFLVCILVNKNTEQNDKVVENILSKIISDGVLCHTCGSFCPLPLSVRTSLPLVHMIQLLSCEAQSRSPAASSSSTADHPPVYQHLTFHRFSSHNTIQRLSKDKKKYLIFDCVTIE